MKSQCLVAFPIVSTPEAPVNKHSGGSGLRMVKGGGGRCILGGRFAGLLGDNNRQRLLLLFLVLMLLFLVQLLLFKVQKWLFHVLLLPGAPQTTAATQTENTEVLASCDADRTDDVLQLLHAV